MTITQKARGMIEAVVGDGRTRVVDIAHGFGGSVVVTVLSAEGDYLTMAVTPLSANVVRVENFYLDLETGWKVGGPIPVGTRVLVTRASA